MGIRGLGSFILKNQGLVQSFKLHDTYVFIDGDNLLYPLYYGNKINVACGGDYNEYAESIRKYFSPYLECNIHPIVIFDGGYDKSEMKLTMVLERINDRLTTVKNIVEKKMYNKQVLPILAKHLFICILSELDIPFAVCEYESDDQITALANHYEYPVISADNDFFISDLHNGFILLDSIETTVNSDIDLNGKEYKYLNCKIYHIDKLLSLFPGIEKNALLLFRTLMGTDYFQQFEFDKFFTYLQSSKDKRIIKLLNWLRGKTLHVAICEVLHFVKEEKRNYVKFIMENTTKRPVLCHCLRDIINSTFNYIELFSFPICRLTRPCGNSPSSYFLKKYHYGHYFSYFANVIVLHKMFLVPQIDDFHYDSSYMCARYIRRVIYGILTHHDVDGVQCTDEKCLAPIEEYDRHGDRFEKEIIEPIYFLDGFGMLPKTRDLKYLEAEKAKFILMKVLGITLDFIANIPVGWQLFIGCTNYWLCNSKPYCTEAFLYSLIVHFMYHEIVMQNKEHEKVTVCCSDETCSSLSHILSKISQLELQQATKMLEKYLSKPSLNSDNPLNVNFVHCYSQFQSCFMSTISLNKLLNSCMKNPSVHKCLNGSFLYNLTKEISMQKNPKSFINEVLGKESLSQVFTVLSSKVQHGVSSDRILRKASV